MKTDDDRLIEALVRRIAQLGLHSHLYGEEIVARELIRGLRDGDGVTMTLPPKPSPTYTRTFTEEEWLQLKIGLCAARATGGGSLWVSMDEQQPDE